MILYRLKQENREAAALGLQIITNSTKEALVLRLSPGLPGLGGPVFHESVQEVPGRDKVLQEGATGMGWWTPLALYGEIWLIPYFSNKQSTSNRDRKHRASMKQKRCLRRTKSSSPHIQEKDMGHRGGIGQQTTALLVCKENLGGIHCPPLPGKGQQSIMLACKKH
eukprot:1024695-Pelagomonas_calceolata.AAC.1